MKKKHIFFETQIENEENKLNEENDNDIKKKNDEDLNLSEYTDSYIDLEKFYKFKNNLS